MSHRPSLKAPVEKIELAGGSATRAAGAALGALGALSGEAGFTLSASGSAFGLVGISRDAARIAGPGARGVESDSGAKAAGATTSAGGRVTGAPRGAASSGLPRAPPKRTTKANARPANAAASPPHVAQRRGWAVPDGMREGSYTQAGDGSSPGASSSSRTSTGS